MPRVTISGLQEEIQDLKKKIKRYKEKEKEFDNLRYFCEKLAKVVQWKGYSHWTPKLTETDNQEECLEWVSALKDKIKSLESDYSRLERQAKSDLEGVEIQATLDMDALKLKMFDRWLIQAPEDAE